MMKRLLHCTRASAAVEAAIFAPIFLLMTLGITDVGTGIFVRMAVSVASQAGAAYAVVNSGSTCSTMTSACLNGIKATMNGASGNGAFCTATTCTASIAACADGAPKCVTVSASYQFNPLLPDALYGWARSNAISSTTTIRFL